MKWCIHYHETTNARHGVLLWNRECKAPMSPAGRCGSNEYLMVFRMLRISVSRFSGQGSVEVSPLSFHSFAPPRHVRWPNHNPLESSLATHRVPNMCALSLHHTVAYAKRVGCCFAPSFPAPRCRKWKIKLCVHDIPPRRTTTHAGKHM